MGRLRTRLSTSALDRQVQANVDVAVRAIDKALQACKTARGSGGIESQRSSRVGRDLGRVKSALGNVRRLTPIRDLSDPDMMSEDDRNRLMRETREAERVEAAAEAAAESEAAAAEAAAESEAESEEVGD